MERKANYIVKKNEKGITIIALIIIIIILLILATITISSLIGKNGTIRNANEAKVDTEISEEKEIVDLATMHAIGENRQGIIEEENLKRHLNQIAGEYKTTVIKNGINFNITFIESNRTYIVDGNGNIILNENEVPQVADKNPGDITDNGSNDGTQQNPYKIYCIEDLIEFTIESRKKENKFEGKYISLENSLDFANDKSYVDPATTYFGDFNENGKIESLKQELTTGKGMRNILTFKGTFDGNENTLFNFYMQDEIYYDPQTVTEDFMIGLVQHNKGVIKNLNINGFLKADIGKNVASGYIGGIAAWNDGGTIENCKSNINISITAPSILKETPSDIDINIGGIAGNNNSSNVKTMIKDSIYEGQITAQLIFDIKAGNNIYDKSRIGGIAGNNGGIIVNCINKGNIKAIKEYKNTTDVTTEKLSLGGISGKNNDQGIIENCINVGNIQGDIIGNKIMIGGIAGETEDLDTCKIYNVLNAGKIYGNSTDRAELGGILGVGYGNLNYGYNIGILEESGTSQQLKGAIIGNYKTSTLNSSIANCKYNKIDNIFGAEGKDITGIEPITNLKLEDCITYLNQNIINNNISQTEPWKQFQNINGNIEIK